MDNFQVCWPLYKLEVYYEFLVNLIVKTKSKVENQSVKPTVVAVCLFCVFLLISYWSIPALIHQEWDSIAYAYYVEYMPFELYGNHPLGHLIASSLYRVATYFGYVGRALTILQIANIVFTSIAIAMFFVILVRRFQLCIVAAAGWSAFMGSGYSLLNNAGTADIYAVSLLFLLFALYQMLLVLKKYSLWRASLAGVLIGLAAMAHQFNAVLLGVFIIVVFWRQDKAALLTLSISSLCATVVGYCFLGFLVTGSLEFSDIYDWVKGYGGTPTFGRSIAFDQIGVVANSGIQSFLVGGAPSKVMYLRDLLLVGIFLLLMVSLYRLIKNDTSNRSVYVACIVTFVLGVGLILWWDAEIWGKFWILLFPFFTILLVNSLVYGRLTQFYPIILAAGVLTVNQVNALRFQHQPDHVFEAALQSWIVHTNPDDVLYEANLFTGHLSYWGDRPGAVSANVLIYYGDDIEDPYKPLRQIFNDAWVQGYSVWFTDGLNEYYSDERLSYVGASREGLKSFLDTFRREGPVFEYREYKDGPVKQVFRLLPPVKL